MIFIERCRNHNQPCPSSWQSCRRPCCASCSPGKVAKCDSLHRPELPCPRQRSGDSGLPPPHSPSQKITVSLWKVLCLPLFSVSFSRNATLHPFVLQPRLGHHIKQHEKKSRRKIPSTRAPIRNSKEAACQKSFSTGTCMLTARQRTEKWSPDVDLAPVVPPPHCFKPNFLVGLSPLLVAMYLPTVVILPPVYVWPRASFCRN